MLCKGYSACVSYGMSTHGYASANKYMYWRMYAGHNCTNYTAYLMIKAGLPKSRPWNGNGGANGWGVANKSRTNSTPAVGAIAWWTANKGHVAYVEAVISPTQILVSEDQWGGDFYWKLLTKDSGYWPNGFIHFKDVKGPGGVPAARARGYSQAVYADSSKSVMLNTTVLKPGSTAWVEVRFLNTGTGPLTGLHLETDGAAASALDGGWTSTTAIATQIEDSVAPGQTATFGFPISIPSGLADETPLAQSFVAVGADGVAVPFARYRFSATADSRYVFTSQPTPQIVGSTTEAQVLTANPGVWRPSGAALSFQWYRNGIAVPGATTDTYAVGDPDVGRTLAVTVTASAPGFISASTASAVTPVIASASPNSLAIATPLAGGQQLVSLSGRYRAYQRVDGALILQDRFTGRVIWSNKAAGVGTVTALNDGVLATTTAAGKTVWATPAKVGATVLIVSSWGKLQLRSATGTVLWSVG